MECTPLYLATFYGCYRKMNLLLMYGANVNKLCLRENSYGSPLHVAAAKDRLDLADLLISYGSQLNLKNALQCTPLQLNINLLSRSDVVQYLVYHGAQVNGVDQWGYTVLAACIRNMRLDCEHLSRLFVYAGYKLWIDQWLRPQNKRYAIVLPESLRRPPNDEGDDDDGEFHVPDIPIPRGRVQDLCDWLLRKQNNPHHLVDVCRISIRQHIQDAMEGRSIVSCVDSLPLPQQLRDFVLFRPWLNIPAITPKEKYSKD